MAGKVERLSREPASAADILGAPRRMKLVNLPSTGLPVYVREMSGKEFARFAQLGASINAADELTVDAEQMAEVVYMTACDDKGVRLFEREQIPQIAEMAFADLQALFLAAIEASGLSKGQLADAEKK